MCDIVPLINHIINENNVLSRAAVPNLFGTRDQFNGRQFCHELGTTGNGFRVKLLHLLCTLFLLLLHCAMHHNAESVGTLSLFSCN